MVQPDFLLAIVALFLIFSVTVIALVAMVPLSGRESIAKHAITMLREVLEPVFKPISNSQKELNEPKNNMSTKTLVSKDSSTDQ